MKNKNKKIEPKNKKIKLQNKKIEQKSKKVEPKNKKIEQKSKKTKQKNSIIILGLVALVLMIVIIGGSYAVFTKDITSVNKYQITVGNFNFTIDNEKNPITLTNTYPMSDTTGKTLTPYTFTLNNASGVDVNYTLKFIPDESNDLDASKVKVYLTQGTNTVGPKMASEITETLYSGTMAAGATLDFNLRMWLYVDATTDESGKTFKGKIQVSATQVTQ